VHHRNLPSPDRPLRRFVKVVDPTRKKRFLFSRSTAETCESLINKWTKGEGKKACGKAPLELVRMEALRPPLAPAPSRGVRGMGTEAGPVFELPPGTGQVFDQVCHSDEAFLQQTPTGGNLAMCSRKKKAQLEADKAEAAAPL
jgi:hypothetical protein